MKFKCPVNRDLGN